MSAEIKLRFKHIEVNTEAFDDPVRRLLIAVLERALLDLADHTVIGYEYHADGTPVKQRDLVFKWILNDDEVNDCSFTFIQICEEIGLDPQATRAKVLESNFTQKQNKQSRSIHGSYTCNKYRHMLGGLRPGRKSKRQLIKQRGAVE